jgi:isoleucyl-tRNA synthetase
MQKDKLYPHLNSNPDYGALEKNISDYWRRHNIFQSSIDNRPKEINSISNEFIFYDGPPFANGLPHYGHLLTGFVKDVYARYQTIKGKKVERRFGWDCHGLPAEMAAEKDLGVSGRKAIIEYGVDKFNDHCKSIVLEYTDAWQEYVTKQGRWVDFENDYKTMDTNFMESVIWAFKELYKKGLIYKAMRVMPYSWACQTPLSNFETRLDNSYRQRADKSVIALFESAQLKNIIPQSFNKYYFAAWTTTPWTLPSNLALAVGADIDYVALNHKDNCYIVAKFAAAKLLSKELEGAEIIGQFKGAQFAECSYIPLFDYFKDTANAFKVLVADFVTEGDGTGIVHIAPGFGEEDQILCQQNNIDIVCPVDNGGNFTEQVTDFTGLNVLEANDAIIIKLKQQGNWLCTEQYLHNYPHCWRTDTPLIYKAVSSWYLKVTDVKDRMVELNQQINWIPGHVKDGLFGKWLENAKDWNISRNRFWGTPMPIWMSDNDAYPRIDVYGSIAELEQDFGVKVTDLHKQHLDKLTRPNPDDPTGASTMRRVEDVFDCWFESGSMPYAQVHYPFENKARFEKAGSADFIVEYLAQTRGWFYTLMVLSTALFDRPPFLNCICHGVILDVNGQKLSKRLQNYADPLEIMTKYGSDALRLTMLSSSALKGEELLIDQDGNMVFDNLRLYIRPIWQAFHFFTLYANSDNIKGEVIHNATNVLDKYILAKLRTATEVIDLSLKNFDSQGAYLAIANFFEVLNNWYIRRSRERFWKKTKDHDKIEAYNCLYTCLHVMAAACSPLLPFLMEEIYLGLNYSKVDTVPLSVHLLDFPQVDQLKQEVDLVKTMDLVRDICSAGLFIRNAENIRIRQPLQNFTIVIENYNHLEAFNHLIQDELNVKEISYSSNVLEKAVFKLSINHSVLAKRLSHKMKDIIKASKDGLWEIKSENIIVAGEELVAGEFNLTLEPNCDGAAKSFGQNQGIVILDTNISHELYLEGIARDIIRTSQQIRKEANLDIADNILLTINGAKDVMEAIENFKHLIEEQTLSKIVKDYSEVIFTSNTTLLDDKLEILIVK